ncbi:MAG: hypothetical protein Ct9H300mP8_07560 [Gammaproteobacteria bacterium]|nr:MAG: hypothetical protein Ct9H300mP8_07560 [Gammaproteobacteria bacterium]
MRNPIIARLYHSGEFPRKFAQNESKLIRPRPLEVVSATTTHHFQRSFPKIHASLGSLNIKLPVKRCEYRLLGSLVSSPGLYNNREWYVAV